MIGNQIVQPGQPTVIGQHWSQTLLPEKTNHDFGVVPSYSNQEFLFEFNNSFDHPIYLVSVRASCGCTKPSIVTPKVEPGETAQVLAKYDTKNFRGMKKATVSVTVRRDQPYTQYGEVQFRVEGTIRRDVVLNPGTVNFDDVTLGESSVRSVQVLYAGNPAWKIKEVKSTNPNLTVEFREIQRNPQTLRVDYEMMINLSADQQVGPIKDQIILTTNDVANKNLAVNIDGNVKAVVQVSPVQLGVVAQDQKVTRKLIIRGHRPFGIKSVSTGDSRINFSKSDGAKTLHIIQYELDTSIAVQLTPKSPSKRTTRSKERPRLRLKRKSSPKHTPWIKTVRSPNCGMPNTKHAVHSRAFFVDDSRQLVHAVAVAVEWFKKCRLNSVAITSQVLMPASGLIRLAIRQYVLQMRYAGKIIKCPKCSQNVTVPNNSRVSSPGNHSANEKLDKRRGIMDVDFADSEVSSGRVWKRCSACPECGGPYSDDGICTLCNYADPCQKGPTRSQRKDTGSTSRISTLANAAFK